MNINNKLIGRQKFNPNQSMKSFPLLAIEQFERCILAHNVEFRGGYNIKRTSINGEINDEYVPDSREVFCNSCKALAILVFPNFSKDMKEEYNQINDDLDKLEKEFLEATSIEDSVVLGEIYYKTTEDKKKFETLKFLKLKKYQELFQKISQEFHKHKFYQTSSTDD